MTVSTAAGQLVVCASHSPGLARDVDERQGLVFRAGMEAARSRVAAFAPDVVVFFGSDHRRTFTDIVPAFAIVTEAAGLGDLGSPTGRYDVPADTADRMAKHLLDHGFDVAVVRGARLDHGFGQTFAQLVGMLGGVPVLPVFVNCATPPLPACARVWELGEAVGRYTRGIAERPLFVGSGGLSHSPPSLEGTAVGLSDEERTRVNREGFEAAKTKIDPVWDREFLGRLSAYDRPALKSLTDDAIGLAGVGAQEVRTWLAAAAAGGVALQTVAYEPVPEWITGMGVAMSAP